MFVWVPWVGQARIIPNLLNDTVVLTPFLLFNSVAFDSIIPVYKATRRDGQDRP